MKYLTVIFFLSCATPKFTVTGEKKAVLIDTYYTLHKSFLTLVAAGNDTITLITDGRFTKGREYTVQVDTTRIVFFHGVKCFPGRIK